MVERIPVDWFCWMVARRPPLSVLLDGEASPVAG